MLEPNRRRGWSLALAVAAVATVVPLWAGPFLPFADMPQHVAAIGILANWWNPDWHLGDEYVLGLGDSQYILYHAVGALFSTVLGGAERGNRVLLTLVGLSYPYALRSLLRALGRDERLALFGASCFWSAPLFMGFLPYVASVPAAAFGMALAIRQNRAPSVDRAAGLALLACALFCLHMSAYLLFVATAAGALLLGTSGARGALQRAPRALLWVAPSAILAVLWSLRGSLAYHGTSLSDRRQIGYVSAPLLVKQLPVWSHDIWRSHADEACAAVLWCAFLILTTRKGPPGDGRLAWIPFFGALAGYVLLPYNVGAATMLNTRMATFVVFFAPLLLVPDATVLSRWALGAIFIAHLVNCTNSVLEIRRIDREELGDLDRLIDRIPPRARVLTLPFELTSTRTHWPPWVFAGSYHVARAGGAAWMSFTELRHWPIHHRPDRAPPAKPPFWTLAPCLFRNDIDGPGADYILVRGALDPFRDSPPGPVWRKIDTELDWTLYQKVDGVLTPPRSDANTEPCEAGSPASYKQPHKGSP